MPKLYGGEVTIDFDVRKHAYTCDGKFIPGVTSILKRLDKPPLIQWAANMAAEHFRDNWRAGCDLEALCKEAKGAHRRMSRDAADLGSIVHKFAEGVLLGQNPPMPEGPASKGCNAFLDWLERNHVEVIDSERIIFSRDDWYAGTTDLFGVINGKLTVADLKTSSGLYPEMLLQTAAYIRAIEEETKERVEQRMIIRLDKKTGDFEVYAFPYSERDVQCFRLLVQVDRFLKQLETEMEQRKAA